MPKLSINRLTESRVQRSKFKPSASGKATMSYEWCSEVRGFGLRITQHGSKSFVFKCTAPSGEQVWLSLGAFTGSGSLANARERAVVARQAIDRGCDPRMELRKSRSRPTMTEFISTYLEGRKEKVKPRTLAEIKRVLTLIVEPTLGHALVDEVDRPAVIELYQKTAQGWRPGGKTAKSNGKATHTTANRMLAYLGTLFTDAERRGIRAQHTNPCRLVERMPESKGRERYLSPDELRWLGKVMTEVPSWQQEGGPAYRAGLSTPSPHAILAIKLLLLTGARRGEILHLRWSQVDYDRRVLVIDDHKSARLKGRKEIPINPMAESVLHDLHEIALSEDGSEWVIPGLRRGAHLVNLQKPWDTLKAAVKRASNGSVDISDVRLHDLRHTFGGYAESSAVSLHMLGSLLGHAQQSTTLRYAHLHNGPQLEASTRIGAQIGGFLIAGGAEAR